MSEHNTLLNNLSDDELLRHFHAQHDPLTSTPITDELAKRFEALVDRLSQHDALISLAEEYELKVEEVKDLIESHPETIDVLTKLLAKLNDRDIHQVEQLTKLIEFADKFRSLASDAGDVFTKLNELITTAQE